MSTLRPLLCIAGGLFRLPSVHLVNIRFGTTGGTTMSTPPAETAARPGTPHGPDVTKVRAAVRGGTLAYFVDQFDIYLPIVVLAPATAYFQAADLSASTTALLASLVFASTLIGRPLGAIIFGHFADTVGRKRTTLVAVGG